MSNLRRQAARALGQEIQDRLGLKELPAIIAAPPSDVADYPRVAVWLEQFQHVFHAEEELMVDSAGDLMMGAKASLLPGVGPARLNETQRLSKVGSIRGSGRIWVGCRLAPLREEMEADITQIFLDDPSAISRLMLTIKKPKVGRIEIPWDWNVAAFIRDTSWSAEFAFSERLWSWTKFDLDLDILVPRASPLITRILVAVEANVTESAEDPTYFEVDVDGNVSLPT